MAFPRLSSKDEQDRIAELERQLASFEEIRRAEEKILIAEIEAAHRNEAQGQGGNEAMTAEQQVKEIYPKAKAQYHPGFRLWYIVKSSYSKFGLAEPNCRESWAWADALRRIK
jgi:hypothetical protein